MVCDFVKDEAGTWWLINVKSFIIKYPIPKKINRLNYDWREQTMQAQRDAGE